MREITWVIITEANYEEVFAELKKNGRPLAVFGLTDQGYANLGLNLSDIRALVQQQQAIIAAYESYQKSADKVIEDANKAAQEKKEPVQESTDKKPFWKVW